MENIIRLTSAFEDQNITTIEYKGRPAWIANEIGRAMGYSNNGRRLIGKISEKWQDELVEGRDYSILRHSELNEFKQLLTLVPESGTSPNTPVLMLLFEPALHFVCLKTNKPIGKKLRRFMVDEVMPQLVRDGAYIPGREVKGNDVFDKIAFERLLVEKAREDRLDREMKHDALNGLIADLMEMNKLDEDVYAAYRVTATEIVLKTPLPMLKPKTDDDWQSPSEIAERNSISPQKVGRIITSLGLRGNKEGLCRAIINKARGHNRTVTTYLYSPNAVELIEDCLDKGCDD